MCAEGVAVMDVAPSAMMQSHRGSSQASYPPAMGDEEISAMLQSTHRQGSLTGMMAPAVTSGLDHLASYNYSQFHPGGYAAMQRTASMPRGGLVVEVSTGSGAHVRPPPQRRPAFNLEESKFVFETKSEVLDGSALRSGASYGNVYETSGSPGMNPAMPPMLHRYHSAPASSFLAEINEGQLRNNNVMSSLYPESGGLTSITENMDIERMDSGTANSNDFEHFMAPENDFTRRAAYSATLRKEEATPDTFGTTGFQASKSLQSAGLSQLNISLHDRMAENGSEKSSSRNSDDNNHLINGYTASMYSQEDFLWKSPTSPAKRQRGLEGDSETSSGSADGSTYRNDPRGGGGLIRHMSLPTSICGRTSPGVDDKNSTVAMRTRAKRGCATHPRSIAERVRRTKISERMKRLQDLVPDMDKQTNTSDMLDETVEYVKSLQQKVQELHETVAQLKAAAAAQQQQNAKTTTNQ